MLSSRKKAKAEPFISLVPDFVTTLMKAPPWRPYSGEKPLVTTWNWRTVS